MVARITAGDWARGLLGYLLGAQLAGSSLVLGQHAAAALWHAHAHPPAAAAAEKEEEAGSVTALVGEPPPPRALTQPAMAALCAEDGAAAALLAAALAGCVAGVAQTRDATARTICLSALCAPFGVVARWYLSRANGTLRCAPWLPLGTLYANVAACILDAALGAAHARADLGRGAYWGGVLNDALQAGLGGGLSTVSTVAGEASVLLSVHGARWRGYAYLLLTWATGFAPAAAIFGAATRGRAEGA
jgi:fluoride ion exporter CrcB/FEX